MSLPPVLPPSGAAVKVVVRLRPMNEDEKTHGAMPAVTASGEHKTVSIIKGQGLARSVYSFNDVFTGFSTQEEVFAGTLAPCIDDVLEGYESTVFAYGQTGTGKTFTMEGDLENPSHYGVIPRSTEAIFKALESNMFVSHRVACSYLEIYNEDLCDLLADEEDGPKNKLEIRNGKNGTFCKGLTEVEVESAEDVLQLMQRAVQSRKIGETKMNKHSSRSHCIFTVSVYAKRYVGADGSVDYHGKLHLVDLAGSECAKNAGMERASESESARERERMNINRSLLTLGRVISAVKDISNGKKQIRIPYRDSKLTRILQQALGGNSKTLIIATLSPSEAAISESISTLNYAQSASCIKNKPISSSFHSLTPQHMGRGGGGSISNGNDHDSNNTVEHWFEMECRLQYMEAQVEEAQMALARKHANQQAIIDRAQKAERDLATKEEQYQLSLQVIDSLEEKVSKEQSQREALDFHLTLTEISLKKTAAILDATQATEMNLTSEAAALIDSLRESIADGDSLHEKLIEKRNYEVERRDATRSFHSTASDILANVQANLDALTERETEFNDKLIKTTGVTSEKDREDLKANVELIESLKSTVLQLTTSIKFLANEDDGVVPSLTAMADDLNSEVEKGRANVATGEEKLVTSKEQLCKQLEEQSNYVKKMDNDCTEAGEMICADVASKIKSSKESVDSMVASMSKSAADFNEATSKARDDLTIMLNEYKKATDNSTNSIYEVSDKQHQKMEDLISSFSGLMQHHVDMKDELQTQRDFMEEKENFHLKDISTQETALSDQKQSMIDARDKQNTMQLAFIENVMKGVEELVKSECDRLTSERETQFDDFQAGNSNLTQLNESMSSTAKDVFETVGSTNQSLTKHVEIVEESDETMRDGATETNDVLKQIQGTNKALQDSATAYEGNFNEKMTELAACHEPLATALETMESDCNKISDDLDTDVYDTAQKGFKYMMKAGNDQAIYAVSQIVAGADKSLNDTITERDEFLSNIENNFDELNQVTQRGKSAIEIASSEQCKTADNLNETVDTQGTDYQTNAASDRANLIDSRYNSMVEDSENHLKSMSETLDTTKTKRGDVLTEIGSYVNNIIHAEEEVPPVDDRHEIEWDSRLSQTAPAARIVESLDLETMELPEELRMGGYSPKKDTRKSLVPVDTVGQSMNKPMSPLSEVSMNQFQ